MVGHTNTLVLDLRIQLISHYAFCTPFPDGAVSPSADDFRCAAHMRSTGARRGCLLRGLACNGRLSALKPQLAQVQYTHLLFRVGPLDPIRSDLVDCS